ncbi:hypothetical protein LSAT2_004569 [Lamellibrachia satsuma]|nr:hypothetical protein LSAT2_004569 [Lamellibrachia satsuma]
MLGFLIISYVWEFIRIYQIERAKKATVLFKGLPLACQPDVMSWWQTLKTWTLSLVSWDQQDPCEKYHLALLVDPVWDVTPPVVLTSVFTRWFTDLMPQFSSAIGQSFQQLFGKLPIQWQPIVFVFGVVLIVLLMLMSCGYRISSPFLGIEHGSHGKRTNISCCCQNQQAAIMDH